MKLKTLFLLLNIVLIAIIALCFFSFFSYISMSESGDGVSAGFVISASVCAILFAVLIFADIFILRRAKMLDALMAENWPALASFFEVEMLEKGRFSKRDIELYISVLVLLSDRDSLRALFEKLKAERLDLYKMFSPDFIAASIVFDNAGEAESCISLILDEGESATQEEREWARFYEAFLAFRSNKYSSASEKFAGLASSADEPVVRAVSGFFCGRLIPSRTFGIGVSMDALLAAAGAAREKTLSAYSPKRWEELCTRMRKRVRAAVIGKTIVSASEWLFEKEAKQAR